MGVRVPPFAPTYLSDQFATLRVSAAGCRALALLTPAEGTPALPNDCSPPIEGSGISVGWDRQVSVPAFADAADTCAVTAAPSALANRSAVRFSPAAPPTVAGRCWVAPVAR